MTSKSVLLLIRVDRIGSVGRVWETMMAVEEIRLTLRTNKPFSSEVASTSGRR